MVGMIGRTGELHCLPEDALLSDIDALLSPLIPQASPGKSAPTVLLLHRIDYVKLKRGSAGRSARRAVCRAADG